MNPSASATTAEPIAGIVFDMDGTLVDNMHVHTDTWRLWHEQNELDFDHETFFRDFAGRSNAEIVTTLIPGAGAEEIERLGREREELYRAIYGPVMEPMPGLVPFIERWHGQARTMAVATAAPPGNAALVLDGLDLRRFMTTCVSPSMGYRGKPHPDLFLAAAAAMNLEPARCVVFEDAPLGVEAAQRAGMRAVAVLTMLPREAFTQDNVIGAISSYDDPVLAQLVGL